MKTSFNALLLAAGMGTRLRPITLEIPKCLVKIQGEPLLGRWLRKLEEAGCESVIINTHYMASKVEAYLRNWRSSGMKINTIYEPKLLGTAGTLIRNSGSFTGKHIIMAHADNVMAGDLKLLQRAHENRSENCLMTMLTFHTNNPTSCGIVTTDEQGVLRGFHEKIECPPGNIANGALYALSPEFLRNLSKMEPMPEDFSTQVIPYYIDRIQTWHTNETYIDIGTPDSLRQAQKMKNLN